MRNCFVLRIDDDPSRVPQIGIADLTGVGDMVPGTMTITRINIPAAHRGKGLGSQLLRMITEEADQEGVVLSLEILPSGPLDYDELAAWYRRHGFFTRGSIPPIFYRNPEG